MNLVKTSHCLFAVAFLAMLSVFGPLLARKARHMPIRALAEAFPLKRWFVELNGGAHRLTGRRFCNTVYRTSEGMLLSEYHGSGVTASVAKNVAAFSQWLAARGTPYLYVQLPMKIDMDGTMMPSCLVQNANAKANAVLSALADNGVKTLDLRAEFTSSSEDVERYFYKTDHHWNNDAVFKVFGMLAPEIARKVGVDPATLVPFISADAWNREVWPQCFLGTKTRRTGRVFGGLDDLFVYTPRFKTNMSMTIPSTRINLAGDFRDTVMWRSGKIHRGGKGAFRTDAYSLLYIGSTYGVARHENPNAPLKCRLMIVGDSFVRPLEAMLSTVVSDILVLDQRRFEPGETVAGFVESFKPDLVLQMNNPSAFGADMLVGPKKRRPVLFDYGELR